MNLKTAKTFAHLMFNYVDDYKIDFTWHQEDQDVLNWLIAEVEQLRAKLQEASVKQETSYQDGYEAARSELYIGSE
jgi:hypothetical protein